MKKLSAILVFHLFFVSSYSQSVTCGKVEIELKKDSASNVFSSKIAIHPLNFEYPAIAIENGIQGLVLVGFDIDDNCQVKNLKIIRGLGYGLDEVALKFATCLQLELDKKEKEDCFELKNLSYPVRFVLNR